MKIIKGIQHFVVVFFEALVEARQMQAKKFARNGWY